MRYSATQGQNIFRRGRGDSAPEENIFNEKNSGHGCAASFSLENSEANFKTIFEIQCQQFFKLIQLMCWRKWHFFKIRKFIIGGITNNLNLGLV